MVGGKGFIGTNLVEALDDVVVIDRDDPLDFAGVDAVVHLAANADVRFGWNDPQRDIEQNLMVTSAVLEQMRRDNVKRIVFASTGSVYHPYNHWHQEDCPVHATSLYAASKIASEQLLAAYATAGHMDVVVLRFVSVLGPHYSHGLVFDFVNKLRAGAKTLKVIAPGTSMKSYVHVSDVVAAIKNVLGRLERGSDRYSVFNVGTGEYTTPLHIAEVVLRSLAMEDTPIILTGTTWVGDNPAIQLSTDPLRALGWHPRYSIDSAVEDTVRWLDTVRWSTDSRSL